MARIVLATFGSFGDLHPFLAVALSLRRRGHHPVIATSEVYRSKVESEELEFAPVRPDVGELMDDPEFVERLWDARRGTEFLLREYVIPSQEAAYDDLLAASGKADLLITHSCTYAGPLVAEIRKLPWISFALQPSVFLSAYDPPALAPAPWLIHLRKFGPGPLKLLFGLAKRNTGHWAEPIQKLRQKIGLPRSAKSPILDGQFSPFGTLALFSSNFAAPQPDWPPKSVCTGFPFYDKQQAGQLMDPDLDAFLASGDPPVVFTLGSSAVIQAGSFYQESIEAARQLKIRAVLLTGVFPNQPIFAVDRATMFVAPYAPYSELLPRCAATVHQGGIGTTAQALRAGRPMLVVPWAHDQPDNGERIRKLGVGRTISRTRYRAARAAEELKHLLEDPAYAAKSASLSRKILAENGTESACDGIEQVLSAG